MNTRDIEEASRTAMRWPLIRFVNWLGLLDNVEECPVKIYVPYIPSDSDQEISIQMDGMSGSIPLCHERLSWRSANGVWHRGPDAFEDLSKRVRDRDRYHDKIFISATISGRLHWRKGGYMLSNCRLTLSDS